MFKSQAAFKSPKILPCLLLQKGLVWEHVLKIIACSCSSYVWINMRCNGGGEGSDAGDRARKKERVMQEEWDYSTLKFVHPESFGISAAIQVSLKTERMILCFGPWGWKLSQHSVHSIVDQYFYNIKPTQPGSFPPKHRQHEMNCYLMLHSGKWLKVALGWRQFGRKS